MITGSNIDNKSKLVRASDKEALYHTNHLKTLSSFIENCLLNVKSTTQNVRNTINNLLMCIFLQSLVLIPCLFLTATD